MSDVKSLYDEDFVAWSQQQAKALRAAAGSRTNQPLDWENVAEEGEDLGQSVRRALGSQIRRSIQHVLKLQYSPSGDPRRGPSEAVAGARGGVQSSLA